MLDWQQRVVDERKELGDKIIKLSAYLSKGAPGALDREVLRRQRNAMLDYADALDDRILEFKE